MTPNLLTYRNNFQDIENIDIISIKEEYNENFLYTIAIPTYKRSKDLAQTLNSIKKQYGDVKFNVLIVDNNPERNDETEQLISTFNIPYTSYIKNSQNIGMCGNWNRLFQLCKTKYLIMLHDDDCLFPHFMSTINHIVINTPHISCLNTNKKAWDGGKTEFSNSSKLSNKCLHYNKYSNFTAFYFDAPSGCLFNVEDVKNIGGFNPKGYPSFDYILILNLSLQNKIILKTKEKLLLYRITNNTTSLLATQIKWLPLDEEIKTELSNILKIPSFYTKLTIYFMIRLRLRAINKIDPNYRYKGLKGGGYIFLCFYKIWNNLNKFIFINRAQL